VIALRDNTLQSRFELDTDAGTAFVTYTLDGRRRVLLHAEVPRALEGRGVGSQLVRAVLDECHARGESIEARCGFIVRYLARHPMDGKTQAP